ncbi:hypothetical protein SHKM778_04370 [Streptomyces sp. KM77-8]|uniref:Pyrrolo-quinoline quinone repeat domain-containing protein n=1 Tax=Streptomyces haneummycinicus TaxID=3074435 RepID=A0AAT9H9X7_9ACTN
MPVRDVLVVAAAKGGIAAHDVVDGSVRWSAPDAVSAGRYLSLSDRLVAAVDRDGTLVTFVASTGEPKWTSPARAASLLAADAEAVYVITEDGRVRAIGRSDAEVRWTVRVDADLGEKAASRGLAARRRLVITAADGSVVALDTADGREVWQHRRLTGSGRAQADHSGGTLCVTGKQLYAFDLAGGRRLWSTDSPKLPDGAPAFWSSPTIDGPVVYATEVVFPFSSMSGRERPPTGATAASSNAMRAAPRPPGRRPLVGGFRWGAGGSPGP